MDIALRGALEALQGLQAQAWNKAYEQVKTRHFGSDGNSNETHTHTVRGSLRPPDWWTSLQAQRACPAEVGRALWGVLLAL